MDAKSSEKGVVLSAQEFEFDKSYLKSAWHPGGHSFAIIGNALQIIVFDAADMGRQKKLDIKRSGSTQGAIAYSPDGKYLAAGNGIISLWDAKTYEWLRDIEGPFASGHRGAQGVTSLAFSPDSRIIALAYQGYKISNYPNNTNITAYSVDSGKSIFSIDMASRGRISSNLAFTPDGKYLIVGRTNLVTYDQQMLTGERFQYFTYIDFLDAKTGAFVKSITPVHVMRPTAIAVSPDGRLVATGTQTLTKESNRNPKTDEWDFIDNRDPIRLWDAETGKLVKELGPITGNVRSIAFSPDGKRLVSCQDDIQRETVALWDVVEGRLLAKQKTPHGTYSSSGCAISPNGKRIAAPVEKYLYVIDVVNK